MPKKIVHKRSSNRGVRPDNTFLTPGEIALNTNAEEPGSFFVDSSNRVRKIGPTHVGYLPPTGPLSTGETWYDLSKDSLNICLDSLSFSGARGKALTSGGRNVLYVFPSDPSSSDSFLNDGLTLPFRTINRAAIEVARRSIQVSSDDVDFFDRFTIVVLPGGSSVFNGPGKPVSFFTAENGYVAEGKSSVLPDSLEFFNPESGGVVVPRGCSILGWDSKKSTLRPVFTPSESRSSILKVTGGSLVGNLSISDKKSSSRIVLVDQLTELSKIAVFVTDQDNCLRTGDKVTLSSEGSAINTSDFDIFSREFYWAEVLEDRSFILNRVSPGGGDPSYVLSTESFTSLDTQRARISVNTEVGSHDQLSAVSLASEQELTDLYVKVQKSFPSSFSSSTDNHQVFPGEVSEELDISGLTVQSHKGLSGVLARGVPSVRIKDLEVHSEQNSMDVYEAYRINSWVSLRESTSWSLNVNPESVTEDMAKAHRLSLPERSVRCLVQVDESGSTVSDRRTFGVRSEGETRAVIRNSEITGCHVGLFSYDGGEIESSNVRIKDSLNPVLSEGFLHRGTALPGVNNSTLEGIGVPRPLSEPDLSLYTKEIRTDSFPVSLDTSGSYDILTLSGKLDLETFEPYKIIPGFSEVWFYDSVSSSWKKASVHSSADLSSDQLSLVKAGNQLSGLTLSDLSSLHIRRYDDRRTPWEKRFHLSLSGSNPPEVGSVLRVNPDNLRIKNGVQLDPKSGGVAQVFTVVEVKKTSDSQFKVTISLEDFVPPYNPSGSYDLGDRVNLDGKAVVLRQEGWVQDVFTNFDQLTSESLQKPSLGSLSSLEDPSLGDYLESERYTRGLGCNSGDFTSVVNGEPGLIGADEYSRKAVKRLLRIMGFSESDANSALVSGSLNYAPEDGYAQSPGPWPVSFLRPSLVELDATVTPEPAHVFGGRVSG